MIRKGIWWVLGAALVLLLPGRWALDALLLEEDTGLYRDNGQWSFILLGAFVAVGLALLLLCRLDKKAPVLWSPRSLPVSGVLAILAGAMVLYSSVLSVVQLSRGELDTSSASLAGEQPLLTALTSVLGLLAALSIMVWGGSLLNRGTLFQDHPIAGLFPPVWGCLELAAMFVNSAAEASVQENFYSVLPFGLCVLFLFGQSSYFSSVGGLVSRRRMYQYGAPFVLLGLGGSLPPLVCLAMGIPAAETDSLPFLGMLLLFSLYALSVLWSLRREESRSRLHPVSVRLSSTADLDRVVMEWRQKQITRKDTPTGESPAGKSE